MLYNSIKGGIGFAGMVASASANENVPIIVIVIIGIVSSALFLNGIFNIVSEMD